MIHSTSNFNRRHSVFDVFNDLGNMHRKFNFEDKLTKKTQLKARLDFLQEELDEAYKALDENNADDFVDAHIDLIVVAAGTLDLAEVNGWLAWDEVHSANMSKQPGSQSKRPEMGMDLVKPEGWQKPCHLNNVGKLPEVMLNDEGYKPTTSVMEDKRRRALEVLDQAKKTMIKKAEDYNFPGSRVKSADYYPRGLDDLEHMVHVKYLRMMSIIDKMKAGVENNFEDLTITLEDLIVFSAMMVEFSEGLMDGQDMSKDLFGNTIVN